MSRKVLPLLLLVIFGAIFWAFAGGSKKGSEDISKQQQLLMVIGQILEQKHYSPQVINDSFSLKVFNKYLENLDGDKNIFLKSDIASFEKYRSSLDDEIHGDAPLKFFSEAGTVFLKRLDEASALSKTILSKPFDFSVNETAQLEPETIKYPSDEAARDEAWRKRLKFMTLERFTELQQQRETSNGKDTSVNKTDDELQAKARSLVLASVNRGFNRQKLLLTEDKQFSTYVNTITDLMDPHTEYFPPVEKRGFDEEMSGRFYGIGAQLKEENGAIKIASLVTGGPAWKGGQVQVNDEILKVAQGNAEPVDVTGYVVTDAVKLIRGTKGSEVRITFKKSDGTIHVVSIIRDEIVLDETYARSTVIKDGDKKIGYIFLPEFYTDFDRADGNRCSVDVAEELKKLKNEKVDGVILDLRNNGGGSLYEVVQMVGLFIKDGPVVQVKDRNGNPSTLSDDERAVLYDGPLAVMVNEFSASASEIFAAAIQDYKRGIIVGSTSTYGKGTVQKNIPLGKPDYTTGQAEYGALKLTFQKFYRVNGGSTQLKGVAPDVVIPDNFEYLKFREKDNSSALTWDQIAKAKYDTCSTSINWKDIIEKANARINASTPFNIIKANSYWLSNNVDKKFFLNIDTYKAEQDMIKKTVNQNDAVSKLQKPMEMQPPSIDSNKFFNNPDASKGDRYKSWLKSAQSDIYINEVVKIVEDMANMAMTTTARQ